MKLIFATNNNHKLHEINEIIPSSISILSLNDCNIIEDIPETGDTLNDNALQKARFIYSKTQTNCFADDTGLEIEALNMEPGVYSARYAGPERDSVKNMLKVLFSLQNNNNRKAQFRTVIALIVDNNEYLFEGIVKGEIAFEPKGFNGFGYDPIFIPYGYSKSFSELDSSIKNKISHRALAVKKLIDHLNSLV